MLKTVSTKEVKVGMYIQTLNCDWMSNPFWKSSFLLESQAELLKLQTSAVQSVVIDTNKGLNADSRLNLLVLDVENNESVQAETMLPETETNAEASAVTILPLLTEITSSAVPQHAVNSPQFRILASEEREAASRAIHSSKKAVASMFNDARMGKVINTDAAMFVVDELTASVTRNEGALISLVRLKTQDDYSYMHSVAVCALMVALARQLKLSQVETRQAGLAGLMHDIGKAAIPNEVLNKPGALTKEEFDLIKLHPERGYELLQQAQVKDSIMLDVCLHHHEKVDGTGYPHRLKTDEISLFAKMGAVCDVYDAITSHRPYKAAWEPGISVQRMAQWKNHFDAAVFKAFVKSVGIYPIGTVVMLKSAHLAVVIDQSPKSLLTPVVKVFFSTQTNSVLTPTLVDLSDEKSADEIVGLENPIAWGITHVSKYWAQ